MIQWKGRKGLVKWIENNIGSAVLKTGAQTVTVGLYPF
jgi:hypothetical protein